MYHQILSNLDVKWTPLKTHYQMDYLHMIHFKWQLNVSFKMSILNLLTLWLQPTHNINCNPPSSKRVLILYNTRKWTVVAYTTILPFYLYFYSGKTPVILDINAKMRSYSLSQTICRAWVKSDRASLQARSWELRQKGVVHESQPSISF